MDAPGTAAATAAWAPGPGQTLGKFTIIEPIGSGGMARLYLARTRGLGGFEKRVVVKQILPHLAEDAEFIARFIQEARLVATLDHPNIAAVYEVDVQDGIYFYSMEYVRGHDLLRVLRQASRVGRDLSIAEIVGIIAGLCAGLHHAHQKRDESGQPLAIVHRDVSPSNVLIGTEGTVKLTDFGVAKARTGMVSTEAGMLRGKIAYMSPEQCRGEALDRRNDVFAVGVLMWEMLAGRRLHQAESDMMLLRKIADVDAPSPREHRPDCPLGLERIVMRALERSAAARYQSAAALLEDLEEFARQSALSISASTIVRMMAELFDGESEPKSALPLAGVIAAADSESATAIVAPAGATPATGTVAPVGLMPARTVVQVSAFGAGGSISEDAPTRPVQSASEATPVIESELVRSNERRWMGPVIGLILGVVLGGGGLYFALRGPQADGPPPSSSPAKDGAMPSTAVVASEEVASDEAKEVSPAEASEPPPAPEAEQPPEASAEASPEASTEADSIEVASKHRRKKNARRRNGKPLRGDDKNSLNLDSAMPPGLGR